MGKIDASTDKREICMEAVGQGPGGCSSHPSGARPEKRACGSDVRRSVPRSGPAFNSDAEWHAWCRRVFGGQPVGLRHNTEFDDAPLAHHLRNTTHGVDHED